MIISNSYSLELFQKLSFSFIRQTGTLTEDGLEVWGAIGVESEVRGASKDLWLGSPCHQISELDERGALMAALATCHSLTYINGQLNGDPLDMQMFQSTKWVRIYFTIHITYMQNLSSQFKNAR